MLEIIGTLVVAGIVIAIVVAIVAAAIKVLIVLLPIILVVAGILFLGWILSNSSPDDKPKTRTKNETNIIYKQRDAMQREVHEEVISLTNQKNRVNLSTIRPELDTAILIVVSAYREIMGDDNFIPLITSANDYEGHAEHSAHYAGAAVDFRIKDIGNLQTRRDLAALVDEYLDRRFLVLHEDIGTKNEHLHVQMRNGTYDRNIMWR